MWVVLCVQWATSEGPRAIYPTLFELGHTYCDWSFNITNLFWDDREVARVAQTAIIFLL